MNDFVIHQTTTNLIALVGAPVAAFTVGTSTSSLRRWARNEARPTVTQHKRLTTAEDFLKRARNAQGPDYARQWFSRPSLHLLDDTGKELSPSEAIQQDRFEQVELALNHFIQGDLS